VRRASAEDVPALGRALGRAFRDDPGFNHVLPAEGDRAERLEPFFATELAPPDEWRVPVTQTIRETPTAVGTFGRRLPVALWSRLRMERHHPRKPPHWYLAVMGVDPDWQGSGLGGALMRPVLDQLDAGAMPAYLEASTPRSRALYERNGFEVTGEFNMPRGGPPIWLMWREPR